MLLYGIIVEPECRTDFIMAADSWLTWMHTRSSWEMLQIWTVFKINPRYIWKLNTILLLGVLHQKIVGWPSPSISKCGSKIRLWPRIQPHRDQQTLTAHDNRKLPKDLYIKHLATRVTLMRYITQPEYWLQFSKCCIASQKVVGGQLALLRAF